MRVIKIIIWFDIVLLPFCEAHVQKPSTTDEPVLIWHLLLHTHTLQRREIETEATHVNKSTQFFLLWLIVWQSVSSYTSHLIGIPTKCTSTIIHTKCKLAHCYASLMLQNSAGHDGIHYFIREFGDLQSGSLSSDLPSPLSCLHFTYCALK